MSSLFNNDKFYRKQFHRHLEAMYKGDGVSIENITKRHATLISKAKQLQSLQSIIESIADMSSLSRNAEGGFAELSMYRTQVESLKAYVANFEIEKLTIEGYADMEREFQLELTNRLLQLDTFYRSMIFVRDQKELVSGAVMGDKELSLVDMQLI